VRRALVEAGVESLPGPFLDFLDPWSNRIEIVGYGNIQFSKAPNVLRGMGLMHLSKSAQAISPKKAWRQTSTATPSAAADASATAHLANVRITRLWQR
jgi:hypothetical protein